MSAVIDLVKSSRHIWWQRPQLHIEEDQEQERKATWLELFFDLVFVAVIAQLSHKLSTQVSWNGILEYTVLFIPVWWAWNGSTFYNERFEVNDVRHRLFTFLKMIAIAGMAYGIHDAIGPTAPIFIWSYVAFRGIMIYMWLSAGKANDPITHMVTKRFAMGLSLSALFWIMSVWAPLPIRLALWGLGLVIDLLTPVVTLHLQARMPKISTSHLPERFGLFVILVIGETIIGVLAGISRIHHLTFTNGFVGILGLFLAFILWWIYFDHIMSRPYKYEIRYILVWCYLHLPLVIGITAIGVGMVNLVGHEGGFLPPSTLWLMCGSVAFVLFTMALIGMTAEIHSYKKVLTFHEKINVQYFIAKTLAALVVLGIGVVGKAFSPLVFLAVLVFIMSSQAVQSLYIWIKAQMAPSRSNSSHNMMQN